jgi:hypothetical protein
MWLASRSTGGCPGHAEVHNRTLLEPPGYLLAVVMIYMCLVRGCRAADVGAAASAAGGSVAAAGYVLACEHGAVRDVTQRYLTNTLALSQLRDVSWWASTVRRISNLRPRPPAYVQLGQAQPPPQHQQQPAPQAVASGQQGKAPAAAAQSQQPNGAVPQSTATPIVQASPSDAPPGSVAPQLVPAPARPPLPPAASAPAQAQHMSAADAAALRARREDMELSHSHRVGLAGLPTSVEGFKAHPTYVLKRHISTYQVLLLLQRIRRISEQPAFFTPYEAMSLSCDGLCGLPTCRP